MTVNLNPSPFIGDHVNQAILEQWICRIAQFVVCQEHDHYYAEILF